MTEAEKDAKIVELTEENKQLKSDAERAAEAQRQYWRLTLLGLAGIALNGLGRYTGPIELGLIATVMVGVIAYGLWGKSS